MLSHKNLTRLLWSRRSSNTFSANHDGVPLIPPLHYDSRWTIWIHPHVVHIYLHMHIQTSGPRFINAPQRDARQKLVLAVYMSVFDFFLVSDQTGRQKVWPWSFLFYVSFFLLAWNEILRCEAFRCSTWEFLQTCVIYPRINISN